MCAGFHNIIPSNTIYADLYLSVEHLQKCNRSSVLFTKQNREKEKDRKSKSIFFYTIISEIMLFFLQYFSALWANHPPKFNK